MVMGKQANTKRKQLFSLIFIHFFLLFVHSKPKQEKRMRRNSKEICPVYVAIHRVGRKTLKN